MPRGGNYLSKRNCSPLFKTENYHNGSYHTLYQKLRALYELIQGFRTLNVLKNGLKQGLRTLYGLKYPFVRRKI